MILVPTTLREQEAIIERNLKAFVETGNALIRIRDEELYREAGFHGFIEWLESKQDWALTPQSAYYQMDAALVSTVVEVKNERQARELAPLLRKATPEVVQQVYAEVVEETGGRPTASAIREKVREIAPSTYTPPLAPPILDEAANVQRTCERWGTTSLDRLSQSDCRKLAARLDAAHDAIEQIRLALIPRLDTLPAAPKGVRA